MGTSKYNLPLVSGSASAKVPRDLNALALAVEGGLKQVKNETNMIAVCVKDYNAIGDGVNDDTLAIQAAMDSGNRVEFEPGKIYYVTSPIFVRNNTVVDLKNATIKWFNTTKATGNDVMFDGIVKSRHFGMFCAHGTRVPNTKQNITAFIPKVHTRDFDMWHSVATVADGSKYATGDIVHLNAPIPSNPNMDYLPGFNILSRVINVVGNEVWLDYWSPFDFTTFSYTNVYIEKINPAQNITFQNANLEDTTPWESYALDTPGPNYDKIVCGIGLYLAQNITINNVNVSKTKNPALMVQYGYDIKVSNLRLDKPTYLSGGRGYTIQLCGSMLIEAKNIYGNTVRHNIDMSYSAFANVTHAKETNCYYGAIDLHGIWEHHINLEKCYGSLQIGNGTQFPVMNDSIYVRKCEIPRLVLDSIIYNLKFKDCNIKAEYYQDFKVNDIVFSGCEVGIKGGVGFVSNDKVGKKTRFFAHDTEFFWFAEGTPALWRVQGFKEVKVDKGRIGSETHHCNLSVVDAQRLDVSTTLLNSVVIMSTTNTSLISNIQYSLDNNKAVIEDQAVFGTSYKRLFNFTGMKNVEGVISVMDNDLLFNSTLFSASTPFDFVSAHSDLVLDNCNLVLKYIGNYGLNKQATSRLRSSLYSQKGKLEIVARDNRMSNGAEQSNTATRFVSGLAGANQYVKLAKITLTESLASGSLSFDLFEVGQAYSSKVVDASLSAKQHQALGTATRKQFSARKLSVLATTDVILIENNNASETTLEIYVKALSSGDIYAVTFQNVYNGSGAFVETYNTGAFVTTLPSGTQTNITVL